MYHICFIIVIIFSGYDNDMMSPYHVNGHVFRGSC
jgi:hypothetical protein